MKIVQTASDFYLAVSPEKISIYTKFGCTVYPVWLGKNRAIMKKVLWKIDNDPPESIYDFLDMVGHFNLYGISSSESPDYSLFGKKIEKSVDKHKIFW